jgi:hypothetical protein
MRDGQTDAPRQYESPGALIVRRGRVTRGRRGRVIPPPPVRGVLSLTVGGGGVGLRRDMTPISIFMEFIRPVRCGGESGTSG